MKYLKKTAVCLLFEILIVVFACFNVLAETNADYIEGYEYPVTPFELIVKGDIYQQICDGKSCIDVSLYKLSEKEARKLFFEVTDENSGIIGCELTADFVVENNCVRQVNVEYGTPCASLMSEEAMTEEVNNILACVDESMSDMEKALVVNDYFVTNYCYDLTYSIYTKEELFINKTGVCSAYALAYQYILRDKLGIECLYVTSDLMNHAWNLLKIDGEWYHVDVTWNDPVADKPGRAVHSYFLLSDDRISDTEHRHHSWNSKYEATDTKYDDYFWSDVQTKILIIDGYYYYITASDGVVWKRNADTGIAKNIYNINEKWNCWNKPGYSWSGCFSQIEYCEDKLFINKPKSIISMDLSGNNDRTVQKVTPGKGSIWGLQRNGNIMSYFVSRDAVDYGIEQTETFVCRYNYTVTFNAAGGTVSQKNKTITYGSCYGELPVPVRENYVFDGWYTTVSGGDKITSQSKFDIPEDRTLYARWYFERYDVTFDANGGSSAPENQVKKYHLILVLTTEEPARNGYVFKGWSENKDAVVADYLPGADFDINRDTTLYAVWMPDISLDGTDGGEDISLLAKSLITKGLLDSLQAEVADVYGKDGIVDIKDLIKLAQMVSEVNRI